MADGTPRVAGFSDKQNAAIHEWASPQVVEICQDGAARSGKTFHTIRAVIDRAVAAPGSRHLVSRLHRSHMKMSVWRQTIFNPTTVTGEAAERLKVADGSLVPYLDTIVPPQYYQVNKQDFIISFWNGSEIIGAGLDTAERVQKILGTEYATVFINEATQITFQTYQRLKTRVVQRVPGISNKMVIDCNPLNRYHWIYQYFHLGKDPDAGTALPPKLISRCHQRTWLPTDNPSLREEDIEMLNSLTGAEHMRLFEGMWVNQEGLVFPEWETAVVEPFHIPADWPVAASVDFGFTNPFSFGWFAYDAASETWYLFDEYYVASRTVRQHCAELKRGPQICPEPDGMINEYIRRSVRPEWITADHDAEDRAQMAEYGFPTIAADKDVGTGVQAVRELLAAKIGLKLRIFRTCSNAISEAALYRWPALKEGHNAKEAPIKEKDHSMDMIRYFCKKIRPTRLQLHTKPMTAPAIAGPDPVPARPQRIGARRPGRWRGR